MGVFGRGRPGWGVIGRGVGCIGVGGGGGAVSVFGDFGLVVGGGGGGGGGGYLYSGILDWWSGGGAIGAWWIHCSIHLQMCSSKTGSVPRTLSLL